MKITAATITGGQMELPAPALLECTSAYDIPADGFYAVFPAQPLQGCCEFTALTVELEGKLVFDGLIDEQILSKNSKGMFLTLKARSKSAVLIDNEAIPQTFTRANLWDIYNAHCKQYGFRGLLCDRNPTLSAFTVAKGRSEWQALESFCRQTLGIMPYISDGYIIAKQRPAGQHIVLSNTSAGCIRFSSLQICNKRYGVISKVILKSESKLYDTAVFNPIGKQLDIRRKRYISPPKEWAGSPHAGADRLMRDSMLKKLLITVTLPSLTAVSVGDHVSIEDDVASYTDLTVYEVTYKADGTGVSTTLALVLPDYVC